MLQEGVWLSLPCEAEAEVRVCMAEAGVHLGHGQLHVAAGVGACDVQARVCVAAAQVRIWNMDTRLVQREASVGFPVESCAFANEAYPSRALGGQRTLHVAYGSVGPYRCARTSDTPCRWARGAPCRWARGAPCRCARSR